MSVSYTHLDVYKRQANVLGMKHMQQDSMLSISKFIDELTANINALNSLNLSVNTFELIFVHFLAQKLDERSADCGRKL